ncbi:hypothetical protein INR49_018485 [Caranx melampygus]|nr:hypothetical protein INR49_018485 [Caranx melampygus]
MVMCLMSAPLSFPSPGSGCVSVFHYIFTCFSGELQAARADLCLGDGLQESSVLSGGDLGR